mmetsp:Transcript_14168/g.20934  ORF Transcript_14168/g.20934 Transcript_14168/m.20934 type:complete len:81 (-) Transcript_14168:23-265(-)
MAAKTIVVQVRGIANLKRSPSVKRGPQHNFWSREFFHFSAAHIKICYLFCEDGMIEMKRKLDYQWVDYLAASLRCKLQQR